MRAYVNGCFNPKRRHSTLQYQTPVEFENNHRASRREAA
ncbi:MAG: hypothetical protein H6732_17040 [Alphaproteobacteria bacterium]|nr:hypothetical protein [Alphaproteobacteria bacterium]